MHPTAFVACIAHGLPRAVRWAPCLRRMTNIRSHSGLALPNPTGARIMHPTSQSHQSCNLVAARRTGPGSGTVRFTLRPVCRSSPRYHPCVSARHWRACVPAPRPIAAPQSASCICDGRHPAISQPTINLMPAPNRASADIPNAVLKSSLSAKRIS